jgi:hypothetical protein
VPSYAPAVVVVTLAVGLILWGAINQGTRRKALASALQQLGFLPCPERKAWLEETINRLQGIGDYPYIVQNPRRLPGNLEVYYYVKFRPLPRHQSASPQEELMFPLKRASTAPLVLTVKPSSVKEGVAGTIMKTLLTGSWAAPPGGLVRIEVPPELKETNLMGILGPPATGLYDLVDPRTLGVAIGLGDAGATYIQFREDRCMVTGLELQVPFKVDELVERMRPLMQF